MCNVINEKKFENTKQCALIINGQFCGTIMCEAIFVMQDDENYILELYFENKLIYLLNCNCVDINEEFTITTINIRRTI